MYKEFVIPYEKQLTDRIASHKIFSYVHTCGAIGDRIDLMAEAGYDGIDTLDPPPLGTVDLKEAKEKYGERFFLKGNLDSINELLYADKNTFETAVLKRLEHGKLKGGYILSTACSVAPKVAPERLRRLIDLTKTYGSYP